MMKTKSDGIRALIVDDEAPARQRISDLLKQDPEVASLQEAADGETAVSMILGISGQGISGNTGLTPWH